MKRVMIITGSGRGIGAATARLAAGRGYSVCINYRQNRDAAEALVRDIRDSGSEANAVPADVASESEVVRLFQEVDAQLGPVTALVNNAGILERQMRVEEMDSGRLTRILTTNVTGSLLCAREAVRQEPECQGCGAVPGRCTPCWRDYTGRV